MELLKQTLDGTLDSNKSSNFQLALAPSLSHEIIIRLDSQPLNLLVHSLKIEYCRTQNDLELFSKAAMLLPVLPFLQMNKGLNFTAERLESIWSKVAEHWSIQLSRPLELDSEFFPHFGALEDLFPTMRINTLPTAHDKSSEDSAAIFGLFQLTPEIVFLLKLVPCGGSTILLQFKAPPGLNPEKTGELISVYNHLIFLLSRQQTAN